MITSRRERWLMWGALLTVLAVLLDSLWLGPLLTRQAAVERRFADVEAELRRAQAQRDLLPMVATELDAVERELRRTAKGASAVLELKKELEELARKAGARSNTIDSDRPQSVDAYVELGYRLDLLADIGALQQLLFLLDTSALPLKISTLTVNRDPKGSDLRVTMRVSMLTTPAGGKEAQ
jgi:hypothetical protein